MLRCLQDTNAELREEIRFHEQRRLEEWNAKEHQPSKVSSKGKAAGARPEAATSTSRSKQAEQSPQQASSQPGMRSSQIASQHALPTASQAHALGVNSSDHIPQGDAYQASLPEDASDEGNSDEADEAIYQEIAEPLIEDCHQQSQGVWMHPGRQAESRVGALPSAQVHSMPDRHGALHLSRNHLSSDQPSASQCASQAMDTFQPIENMSLQDAASWTLPSASASQHQGGQAGHTAADRYQHATAVASPDDFVWQPIRPQTAQQAEQHAYADSMASADNPQSTWMPHVAPNQMRQVSTSQPSRSLRESLDAAARLDSRLQLAQQEQQQWQLQESKENLHAGQTESVMRNPAASSSWRALQGVYAAAQPAVPQNAAAHKQHAVSSSGNAQPQPEAMPYIDSSRRQTAADGDVPGLHHTASISGWAAEQPSHAAGALSHAREGRSREGGPQYSGMATKVPLAPGPHLSSTAQAQHGQILPATRGSGHHEASAAMPAAGSDTERPYQVSLGSNPHSLCLVCNSESRHMCGAAQTSSKVDC